MQVLFNLNPRHYTDFIEMESKLSTLKDIYQLHRDFRAYLNQHSLTTWESLNIDELHNGLALF